MFQGFQGATRLLLLKFSSSPFSTATTGPPNSTIDFKVAPKGKRRKFLTVYLMYWKICGLLVNVFLPVVQKLPKSSYATGDTTDFIAPLKVKKEDPDYWL